MSAELAHFGRRLRQARESRHMGMRELAVKADVSTSTISRAERGHEIWLTAAIRMAGLFGATVDSWLREPHCLTCYDQPPRGFTCNDCGQKSAARGEGDMPP